MQEVENLTNRVALGIRETATALGVSEGLVRKWLPQMPHTRLGERVLIPVDPLKKWLQERSQAEMDASRRSAAEILKALDSSG
ncbi:helix-turn-helix domain-containing protein [Myxococcota bacterium]|jgi:excisionase family DNA binding protein|nr:helix-turn-helix domain-containing protein [Myxococcota bacterium]